MELTKVAVTRRGEHGKSEAARLRREGQIPAVAYWKGEKALTMAVAPKQLVEVLGSERGRNTVLELNVEGGESFPVLLADFQYHPVSRKLLHADFLRIALDTPVDVDVPLITTGKCIGVTNGGTLHVVFRKLPVRCLPKDIPVKITLDITDLDVDGHIAVKDLPLAEGVSVRLAPTQTVVAVVTEAGGEGDAPAAAAADAGKAAAAPAAAGKAAAPAAAGKAAAPAAAGKAAAPAAPKAKK
ncbi:MAG: 50S ribosomal protein L25 [Polyangiaceae bacterium]